MSRKVRTRFAPSPTGDLHLGNLRAAIFNYCFARKEGGAFVLRIEDTDSDRNREGSIDGILADLRWAGLEWDEGPDIDGPFAPYLQSQRGERHRELALMLERSGAAYRCWCREDEEEEEFRGRSGSPGCSGGCRELGRRGEGREEAYSLRFAAPNSVIEIQDEVRGTISFEGRDIGDFIILRSDGRATYNFAVVADDIDMEISHVIRGAGHLPNTPKQALLFDALGASRPVFVHLPTVLAPDGGKLSKRSGAAGLNRLREAGYHPQGVVNYLSLLGWSAGGDREILSKDELIEAMDLGRIGASDTAFDPEKLLWVSGQHIARMELSELVAAVRPFVDFDRFPLTEATLPIAVEVIRSRLRTFAEAAEHLGLLFPPEEKLAAAREEIAVTTGSVELLRRIRDEVAGLDPWDAAGIGACVRDSGKAMSLKGPALFHPVRLALFADRNGPDLGRMISALGRERTAELLDRAIGETI